MYLFVLNKCLFKIFKNNIFLLLNKTFSYFHIFFDFKSNCKCRIKKSNNFKTQ